MESTSVFSHQLRTRACGLLVKSRQILLVQIHSPARKDLLWMPPGGAVNSGETLRDATKREFSEETNLQVTVGNLLHINEFIESSLHAIEFFFEVTDFKGKIKLGTDPELKKGEQLIRELRWFPIQELPRESFTPQSLLPILQNWQGRQSLPISEHE